MRRSLFTFAVAALILSMQGASGLTFPQPTGYVSDFANVIDKADARALEARITAIERNSTAEIAVVTVPNLQNTTVEDYAVKLFEAWGIGKRGSDNGLLILVAPNERVWKIEVGYGLEPTITDSRAGEVGRSCFTENFRALKYGDGLECAVASFGPLITGDGFGNLTGIDGSNGSTDGAVFLAIFLLAFSLLAAIVIVIIILALRGKMKPSGGRRSSGGRRGGGHSGWGGGGHGGGGHSGGGFGGGRSGGGGASGGW